jgi:hypothetical protein
MRFARLQVVIYEATGHRRGQGSGGNGSDDDASSQSSSGSPKGARGGGTLKTCAVCLEDYRRASALDLTWESYLFSLHLKDCHAHVLSIDLSF